MAVEDVLEVRRKREVHVEEVGHVDHVVDDLAAVCALDADGVPGPVAPLVRIRTFDVGDRDVSRCGCAFRVVPDEQHVVLFERGPRPGARAARYAFGVRNARAFTIAGPAPVVERASDGIVLDFSPAEVAAHMPAVCVENVQCSIGRLKHDQLGSERLDRVRLPVAERIRETDAVPAPREAGLMFAGIDVSNRSGAGGCVRYHDGSCPAVVNVRSSR